MSTGIKKTDLPQERVESIELVDQLLSEYQAVYKKSTERVETLSKERLKSELKRLNVEVQAERIRLGLDTVPEPKSEQEEKEPSPTEKKLLAIFLAREKLDDLRTQIVERLFSTSISNEKRLELIQKIFTKLQGANITDIVLIADLTSAAMTYSLDTMMKNWSQSSDSKFLKECKISKDSIQDDTRPQRTYPMPQEIVFHVFLERELKTNRKLFEALSTGTLSTVAQFATETSENFKNFLKTHGLDKDFFRPNDGAKWNLWYVNLCELSGIEMEMHQYNIANMYRDGTLKIHPQLEPVFKELHDRGPFNLTNYGPLAGFGFDSIHFEGENFVVAGGLADFFGWMRGYIPRIFPTPGSLDTTVDQIASGAVEWWGVAIFLLNVLPFGVTQTRHILDALEKLWKRDFEGAWHEMLGWGEKGETFFADFAHFLISGHHAMAWIGIEFARRGVDIKKAWEWLGEQWEEHKTGKQKEEAQEKAEAEIKEKTKSIPQKNRETMIRFLWDKDKYKPSEIISWTDKHWNAIQQEFSINAEDIEQFRDYFRSLRELRIWTQAFFYQHKFSPDIVHDPEISIQNFDTFVTQYYNAHPDLTLSYSITFDHIVDIGLITRDVMDNQIKKNHLFSDPHQQEMPVSLYLSKKLREKGKWIRDGKKPLERKFR